MNSRHLAAFIAAALIIGLVFLFVASVAVFLLPLIIIFAALGLLFGRRPARIVRIRYGTPPKPAEDENIQSDDAVIDIKAQEVEPERRTIGTEEQSDL